MAHCLYKNVCTAIVIFLKLQRSHLTPIFNSWGAGFNRFGLVSFLLPKTHGDQLRVLVRENLMALLKRKSVSGYTKGDFSPLPRHNGKGSRKKKKKRTSLPSKSCLPLAGQEARSDLPLWSTSFWKPLHRPSTACFSTAACCTTDTTYLTVPTVPGWSQFNSRKKK